MLSMKQAERRAFLQFVTGSPTLPAGGLASLEPPLTVAPKQLPQFLQMQMNGFRDEGAAPGESSGSNEGGAPNNDSDDDDDDMGGHSAQAEDGR